LLAEKLEVVLGRVPVFPVESSAVFFRMPESFAAALHKRGWHFYKFIEPDVYRFMCAWSTTETQIDEFADAVRNSLVDDGNGA
jgi:threonine aldolase